MSTIEASGKTRSDALDGVNELSRGAIEALPAAIYMTDVEGRLTFYNEAAAELWGCRPELGESKFCGSWKLYRSDGTPLPHDECPMALALRERRPIRGMEAVAERPDGTRIPFIPYPTPLFDESGRLTGAINMLVDISERKRAEADLAERQAQLALFVEHAPAAIAMFDREMRYLAVSRRFAVDFRLPPHTQLIGKSHYEVFPEFPQRWREIHALVLAGEEFSREEDQFTRQDGRTDWTAWSVAPWCGADGRIGGAILFAEVRTQNVEARHALADSEARFRATFENAAVGVALVGTNGSILRVNNSFARMLGYAAEELTTKTFQRLTHPDDLAINLSLLNTTLVGEADSYCIEKRYVRNDGGIVWASLTVGCVRKADGGVDYFVSVIQDITDRKLAEQALAERNIQLGLAAKAGLVGTYAYDVETEIMQISDGYAAIHGFPEGTSEIRRSECLGGVHPDDVERLVHLRDDAFRASGNEYSLEYRVVRPGGEVRWVEARGFISYNDRGCPHRVIGVNIDITERKRVEQQQDKLVAELDHRVKNVLATVQAVAAQTMRASSSMEHFVAAFDGRIRSMGSTHELLSRRRWADIPLTELVKRELAPYTIHNNTKIDGPEVMLSAEAAQSMAMVLHELVTNAAKYGALSTRDGRASVRWHLLVSGDAGARLCFEWQETGGPIVQPSKRPGYGTEVIRNLLPHELGGKVDMAFPSDGVRCRLDVPLSRLAGGDRLANGQG
jgi:PAS domain S-box-containing protein